MPSRPGSSRIMRTSTPSVTTSMRLAADARVSKRARIAMVRPTSSPSVAGEPRRGGARREPARLDQDDAAVLRPGLVEQAPAAIASSCRRPATRPPRRARRPPATRRRRAAARPRWEASEKRLAVPDIPGAMPRRPRRVKSQTGVEAAATSRVDGTDAAPYTPRRSGAVAQMGERCNRTAEVRGSIPLSSTKHSGRTCRKSLISK